MVPGGPLPERTAAQRSPVPHPPSNDTIPLLASSAFRARRTRPPPWDRLGAASHGPGVGASRKAGHAGVSPSPGDGLSGGSTTDNGGPPHVPAAALHRLPATPPRPE